MGRKLIIAIAFIALMAVPAFASVQNVKVGGSITETSVLRTGFDGGDDDYGGDADMDSWDRQNEIVSKVNLDISADLTDNVSTFVQLTNQRLWGSRLAGNRIYGDTNNDQYNRVMGSAVRLNAAYITMKELLYSPLTVTVGRQPLAYGNMLIIGKGDFSTDVPDIADITGGANFDAIKAVLNYDPLTIDLFAARINNNDTTSGDSYDPSSTHDNINLYGLNLNYKLGDKMSTVVEGYVFLKKNDSTNVTENRSVSITSDGYKSMNVYVPGLRVSTNPIEGLNVQLEGAYQGGTAWDSRLDGGSMSTRSAFAFQGMVNYALPVMKDLKPVVGAAYTYLSGYKQHGYEPASKTTGWDPMFMNQNSGRIFHALGYDSTNSQIATLSAELTPIKDLTAKASWNGLWVAEKSWNSDNGGSWSPYVGSEVDLDLSYAYTEDVKFGVSAGYFCTGKAFNAYYNHNAQQLLTSVAVAF